VDAQLQVVKKLEEKEQLLQTNLTAMEKELSLRTQTLDMHKRKVRGQGAGGLPSSPIRAGGLVRCSNSRHRRSCIFEHILMAR
ncbi:hypothetical protein chiPu_0028764, partial [Chiloscyllium punctatum]|nr:hypothetical protein [Chiloscyllium punctatum]